MAPSMMVSLPLGEKKAMYCIVSSTDTTSLKSDPPPASLGVTEKPLITVESGKSINVATIQIPDYRVSISAFAVSNGFWSSLEA